MKFVDRPAALPVAVAVKIPNVPTEVLVAMNPLANVDVVFPVKNKELFEARSAVESSAKSSAHVVLECSSRAPTVMNFVPLAVLVPMSPHPNALMATAV
jgi:hypothetical protein|tara:strand:- start:2506 stop:2802 length:297 start_codon:yes stop_codon:yes gene_type:complete